MRLFSGVQVLFASRSVARAPGSVATFSCKFKCGINRPIRQVMKRKRKRQQIGKMKAKKINKLYRTRST